MINPFKVETAFLSDDEANRLYTRYPNIGESPESYCPTCHKAGEYTWKSQVQICSCAEQLQLYKLYLAAGIGTTYQRLDWSDFEGADDIVQQLSKYIFDHQRYIDRGVGLFFQGDHGTGKTMLATLVLKEFVKKGYTAFATTFSQTTDYLTAGWHDLEEKAYFRRKFVDSRVLLLDDVGRELKTRLSEATFDSILRTRVQEGRPTFITTNITPEEMAVDYGTGVLSLLKELSLYYSFTGDDFRSRSQARTVAEITSGETRPIF